MEVREHLIERKLLKEEERRITIEMRKIAEEEIMRELRMAEELHNQAPDFQKTKRHLGFYAGDLLKADDFEEEQPQKETQEDTRQQADQQEPSVAENKVGNE